MGETEPDIELKNQLINLKTRWRKQFRSQKDIKETTKDKPREIKHEHKSANIQSDRTQQKKEKNREKKII